MAGVEKISISLTAEMVGAVNAAVRSGEYASQSEVIREALRNWQKTHASQWRNIDELRQLVKEGMESGDSHYRSVREIKEAAQKRHTARQKKKTKHS